MRSTILVIVTIVVLGGGAYWYLNSLPFNMSGTYVEKNDRQAFLAEVVQGAGGQLTGVYEEADLGADGSLQQGSIPLVGSRDGRTIWVTLTPSGLVHFFEGNVTLSGRIVGSILTLAGATNDLSLNLRLSKADLGTYQEWVSHLGERSAAILAARAMAARRNRQREAENAAAQAVAAASQRLEQEATQEAKIIALGSAQILPRIQQLKGFAEKLGANTTKMQALVNMEDANGGYLGRLGNQVASTVQQLEFQDEQFVNNMRDHFYTVQQSGIIALLHRVKQTVSRCRMSAQTGSTSFASVDSKAEQEACSSLEKATPGLKDEVGHLEAAYQALFSAWVAERLKQEAIVNQAFR